MKKLLLLALPVCMVLLSCDLNGHGKKIEFGKSEVYYKGEGVTEEQAKMVGDYLQEIGWLDEERAGSAQLVKEDGTFLVRLVVDPKVIEGESTISLWHMQHGLSENVFDGKPARFVLVDDEMNEVEVLDPVDQVKLGNATLVYDSGEFREREIKALGKFMLEQKMFGSDKPVDIIIRREEELPIIRLIASKKYVKDHKSSIIPEYGYWQHQIQQNLENFKKARLVLTDREYEDFEKIPKITADQLATFENKPAEDLNLDPSVQLMLDSMVQRQNSGVLRTN